MQSVVCTLFERDYHYGVAALTNSLYKRGYRGSIYAGYRGSLPSWCSKSRENRQFQWENSTTLEVAEGLQIHFLPLDTNYHLTNYKPDFMLRLLSGPASDADSIYYLDPDIVVMSPWSNFKDWTACGVALCEDLNSPLPKYHPRRMGWRNYYAKSNIVLNFKDPIYANGGFVGLRAKDFDFLNLWRSLQELMAPLIGGLDRSVLSGTPLPKELRNRWFPFGKTDQDVLNAAVEVWEGPVSFLGKEGMGFKPGFSSILPHALGEIKPWKNNFLWKSLAGNIPREVDKKYWNSVSYPIKVYSGRYIFWKRIMLNIASFIGRFYTRN